MGDDALFSEAFGRVDTDENGENQILHADDRCACRRCRSQQPVRCAGDEFDFEPTREEDLFREFEDDANGVYHLRHRRSLRMCRAAHRARHSDYISDELERRIGHVVCEGSRTGVTPGPTICPLRVIAITDPSLDRLSEMTVVEGVGDVVGLTGCGEVGWGEVEVEGEVDGLGAGAVPVVGADGGGEVEGGEGDDVGGGGGGHGGKC